MSSGRASNRFFRSMSRRHRVADRGPTIGNVSKGFSATCATGARWQDIPVDLPSGSTCWRRLQEWSGEGILEEIHSRLIEELGELGKLHLKELVMDATFIRAKKG